MSGFNLESAKSFLEELKTFEKTLRTEEITQDKINELNKLPSKVYTVIDVFSDSNDIAKIAEIYQTTASIFKIASSKSKDKEFAQKAKMLASVWKEKADVEQAAIGLRQDIAPRMCEVQGTLPSSSHTFFYRRAGPRISGRELRGVEPRTVEARISRYYTVLRETREPEKRRITDIFEEIPQELQDVTEPSKGRVLTLILHKFFNEQGLLMKTNYSIQIQIGPNIVEYRTDLALFDASNNLEAIIEIVNNLTPKKAKDLSLYLLQIRQKMPDVKQFVVFIKATDNAVQFMKPIVNRLYSINKIPMLLRQFQKDRTATKIRKNPKKSHNHQN